jgi:hypothetical protein
MGKTGQEFIARNFRKAGQQDENQAAGRRDYGLGFDLCGKAISGNLVLA